MKKSMIILMALTMCISFVGVVNATLVTQDFEGIPILYHNGGSNLDGYLPGLNFSTSPGYNVNVLEEGVDPGYNSYLYPPHSDDAVIFSYSASFIRVDFTSHPDYVEAWYNSKTDFFIEAYNSANVLLASNLLDPAPANVEKVYPDSLRPLYFEWANTGPLSLSVGSIGGGMNIAYVIFHDDGNFYTLDDLAYNIPEPATMAILGLGGLFCARLKRR